MSSRSSAGRRAADPRLVVVLVIAVCLAALTLGWWSKARCLTDGVWAGGEQYRAACYTDVFPLWFAHGLDSGDLPYWDQPVEYPVLTGAQMALAAGIAPWLVPAAPAVGFYHATALLAGLAGLGTLAGLWAAGLPPRRLLWWAAAPPLVLYAFMNWDLVPVLALVLAVVLHRRGRDLAAGVAVGLGAAAKLFPALLAPLVVAARLAQGRRRDAALHLAGAAGAWLAVNLPVAVGAPRGWWRFVELNQQRPPDWDSLWFLVERLRDDAFAVATVNAASLALFLAGGVALVVIGARRRAPERWWELALPLLCWFLLTNKVYSPQFSLWIVPLAAAALPRFPPFAAFIVADTAVFLTRFPFLGGMIGFEPAPGYAPFGAAVALRAVVLVWLIVSALRRSPEEPVLAPAVGPARRAPD